MDKQQILDVQAELYPETHTLVGKSLTDLKLIMQDLADDAQTIVDKLDRNEELTEGDVARQEALLNSEIGLIAKCRLQIDGEEKRLEHKATITAARLQQGHVETPSRVATDVEAVKREFASCVRTTRLVAFASGGRTQREATEDAFYCGHWLKSVMHRCVQNGQPDEKSEPIIAKRGWEIKNQQTIGTDADGGYLVPTPLAQTIIDNRESLGIMRQLADVVPMTANTLKIPKTGAGLTVYAPGEATTITASKSAYSQVALTALKRCVANQISVELNDDAIVSMTERAIMEMVRALVAQEDYEFVNADGTSGSPDFDETGLITALDAAGDISAAATRTTWDTLQLEDVMKWIGSLPSQFSGMTSIICSREFFFQVLMRLAAGAGGNDIASLQRGPDGVMSTERGIFMGIPVFFTSQMPTATGVNTISALYGSFRQAAVVGDRTGPRIGISFDAAFLDDLITLKTTSRYDLNVHEGGSSSIGAYVALSTAAS